MGAVLGVSLSATRAGVVVLEGIGDDARTVVRDAVAVSAAGLDVIAAAVAQAARTAANRGYPVQAVGLTGTADAEQYALGLAGLLADSGIAAAEMFEPADAVAALAEVVASSKQRATVSLVTDDAALASLDQLAADREPGAVFVMVPHDLVVDGFAERVERTLAPRTVSLIDAELGLARGAALAAGNAGLTDVLVDEPIVPVRQRLHRADLLLVAAVAVTLLVAATTVFLARGALFGSESAGQASISAGAARDDALATPPPSSAVAPPVSAAEQALVGVPPVSAPEQAEPPPAEARLRRMTEPLAESAPAPVAPPVEAPAQPVEEPARSPIQDAIAFVEQTFGIDVDNDGLINGRPVNPAPLTDATTPG